MISKNSKIFLAGHRGMAGSAILNRLKKDGYKNVVGKDEKYFLVMIHPDTTNKYDIDMNKVLNIINSFGKKVFLFYPNVDANNTEIISSIAQYSNNYN